MATRTVQSKENAQKKDGSTYVRVKVWDPQEKKQINVSFFNEADVIALSEIRKGDKISFDLKKRGNYYNGYNVKKVEQKDEPYTPPINSTADPMPTSTYTMPPKKPLYTPVHRMTIEELEKEYTRAVENHEDSDYVMMISNAILKKQEINLLFVLQKQLKEIADSLIKTSVVKFGDED